MLKPSSIFAARLPACAPPHSAPVVAAVCSERTTLRNAVPYASSSATLLVFVTTLCACSFAAAKDPIVAVPPSVAAVFKQHCYECHGPDTAEAGLRLDRLPADFATVEKARLWTKVHDRISAGEMPPKD